jgi:hypothetical protein
LIRNARAPVEAVIAMMPDLTLRDLQDISSVDGLAPHLRRHIEQELSRRAAAAKRI